MRDLVARSGLTRETIHFYITQGLLPKPIKTGRNTAVYSEAHYERLQRIRELQERHFLPLRAIRAVLEEGGGEGFTGAQEDLLRRVRDSLPAAAGPAAGAVPLARYVPERLARAEVDAMRRLGLIEVHGRGAAASVGADDARILDCWVELRSLEEPGDPAFTPDLLTQYAEAMDALVEREARVLAERFATLPGQRAARIIEATEPLLGRLLVAFRRKKIAALLQRVGGAAPDAGNG